MHSKSPTENSHSTAQLFFDIFKLVASTDDVCVPVVPVARSNFASGIDSLSRSEPDLVLTVPDERGDFDELPISSTGFAGPVCQLATHGEALTGRRSTVGQQSDEKVAQLHPDVLLVYGDQRFTRHIRLVV